MNKVFLKNIEWLFSAREKVFINFRSRLFQIKVLNNISTCKPTPEVTTEQAPGVATEHKKTAKSKTKPKMSSWRVFQ